MLTGYWFCSWAQVETKGRQQTQMSVDVVVVDGDP